MAFVLAKKGDQYLDRFIPEPEYYFTIPFQLNKKQETTLAGHKVTYKYNITESTPERLTILAKVTCGEETAVYINTFTKDGKMTTSCKTSKGEYNVTFNKVVPIHMRGKFEDIPEKAENWDEVAKGQPEFQPCKYIAIKRESQDHYIMEKTMANGAKFEFGFELNKPGQASLPNGKVLKYNFFMDFVEESPVLGTHNEVDNEKFDVAILPASLKTPYVQVIYKRGDTIARRFYRRVPSPMIFGKFESNEESEELTKFLAATASPNMVSIEYSKTTDGKLAKKGTTKDGKTVDVTFELGKPNPFTANGKNFEGTYYIMGEDKSPYMIGLYKEVSGPNNFAVVIAYASDHATATFIYGGNVTIYGENVVKRVYTRVGAPVTVV